MKIFYAHPKSLYGTQIEKDDISLLQKLFGEVVNPGETHHQLEYQSLGIVYSKKLLLQCDGLVFRTFPMGKIGAGIVEEIKYAKELNRFILELPEMDEMRNLTIEETGFWNRVYKDKWK